MLLGACAECHERRDGFSGDLGVASGGPRTTGPPRFGFERALELEARERSRTKCRTQQQIRTDLQSSFLGAVLIGRLFTLAFWIPPAGGISIDLSNQRSGLGRSIPRDANRT